MLPKKFRLKKNQDFQKVFREGKFFNGRYLSLRLLKKEYPLGTRVGFAVSKKIICKAKRNLLKRRLREIYRQEKTLLNNNFDIVIIIKNSALKTPFSELKKDVFYVLKKANLY